MFMGCWLTCHEGDCEQDCEAPYLPENHLWEERGAGHCEVVDEACHEREEANHDGGNDRGAPPRVGWLTPPAEADKRRRQATGVKNEGDEVDGLDLVPSRPFKVKLGPRRWEVKDKGANQAEACKDEADVVAPPPSKRSMQYK